GGWQGCAAGAAGLLANGDPNAGGTSGAVPLLPTVAGRAAPRGPPASWPTATPTLAVRRAPCRCCLRWLAGLRRGGRRPPGQRRPQRWRYVGRRAAVAYGGWQGCAAGAAGLLANGDPNAGGTSGAVPLLPTVAGRAAPRGPPASWPTATPTLAVRRAPCRCCLRWLAGLRRGGRRPPGQRRPQRWRYVGRRAAVAYGGWQGCAAGAAGLLANGDPNAGGTSGAVPLLPTVAGR